MSIYVEKNLAQIIEFKQLDVIARFKKDFPEKSERAEEIFADLMRFFWATNEQQLRKEAEPNNPDLDFLFIMDSKMKEVDEMWHVFLLFTKPYMDFCEKFFGRYIHHTPNIAPDLPTSDEYFEKNLSKFLNFSLPLLGEATIRRWFQFY